MFAQGALQFLKPNLSVLIGKSNDVIQKDGLQKQGKSEGFDSCDQPSNLTKIGFKSSIFQPVWPWHLMDDLEKL